MFHGDDRRAGVAMTPDQPLSWVLFCAQIYAPEDFLPEVPDVYWSTQPRNSAAWRSWRESVWADISDPTGAPPVARIPGMDADHFSSLAGSAALQETCRQRWSDFVRWWRPAKEAIVAATHAPEIATILRAARRHGSEVLTLHIVPLKAAQDLASNGSHHAVSLGLVQDHGALHRWLVHQD